MHIGCGGKFLQFANLKKFSTKFSSFSQESLFLVKILASKNPLHPGTTDNEVTIDYECFAWHQVHYICYEIFYIPSSFALRSFSPAQLMLSRHAYCIIKNHKTTKNFYIICIARGILLSVYSLNSI